MPHVVSLLCLTACLGCAPLVGGAPPAHAQPSAPLPAEEPYEGAVATRPPARTAAPAGPAAAPPWTAPPRRPAHAAAPGESPGVDLARDILRWTNVERLAAGLPPLTWSDRLATAARRHSEEMAALRYFSHTSPTATSRSPLRRAQNAGVNADSLMVAENLAMGTFDRDVARALVKLWMDSQGHRENLLRQGVEYLGVGLGYRGGTLYATQLFASAP